jgi:serine protease Do
VGEVTPNSPAAHGGLKQGDVIVGINGENVADANQLRLKIGMMAPNSSVAFRVIRDGKTQTVNVTLAEYPSKEERAGLDSHSGSDSDSTDKSLEGVSVENLTPDTAKQLKLPESTPGVVVAEVNPSSRAADAGLQTGDVIQQVNRQPVANVKDFGRAVGKSGKDDSVLLLVDRGGTTLFLAV